MENERAPLRRRKPKSRARRWLQGTLNCTAPILGGAIIARLVMMTIDLIAARNGGAVGGEIFLPLYAVALLTIGWRLRSAWTKAQTPPKQTTTTTPKYERSNTQ